MKPQAIYHALSRTATSDEMRLELASLTAELSYVAWYLDASDSERLLAEVIAKVEVMIERYRYIGFHNLIDYQKDIYLNRLKERINGN